MRAELCRMGLRDDPLSEKLLRALPWVPHFARRCAFAYFGLISRFNMVWHHYPITDGDLNKIRWRDVVSLRTQLIDETIRESDAAQLVILGAGFDTRALQPLSTVASRFEIDFPPTQEAKVAAVAAAGIDASNTIFVGVDFNKGESWLDKLKEAGFDPKKKTVFVWEGKRLSPLPLFYLGLSVWNGVEVMADSCCPLTSIPLLSQPRCHVLFRRHILSRAAGGQRDCRAREAVLLGNGDCVRLLLTRGGPRQDARRGLIDPARDGRAPALRHWHGGRRRRAAQVG